MRGADGLEIVGSHGNGHTVRHHGPSPKAGAVRGLSQCAPEGRAGFLIGTDEPWDKPVIAHSISPTVARSLFHLSNLPPPNPTPPHAPVHCPDDRRPPEHLRQGHHGYPRRLRRLRGFLRPAAPLIFPRCPQPPPLASRLAADV